jgi:hypothetical protein
MPDEWSHKWTIRDQVLRSPLIVIWDSRDSHIPVIPFHRTWSNRLPYSSRVNFISNTGSSGRQHGYEDHRSEDGRTFFYFGEGQR